MPDSHEGSKKSKVPDYLPLGTIAALGAWLIVSRLGSFPHPPVGTFIGVLAFVAGIVTIWPPDSAWAKAAWLVVFGAFLVLEISTLYHQRAEDEATAKQNRIEEDNRFAEILRKQDASFAAVIHQSQEEFTASLRRMESTFDTITGGNSYPTYSAPIIEGVENGIQLMVMVHGKYSIRDAAPKPSKHGQQSPLPSSAWSVLNCGSAKNCKIQRRALSLLCDSPTSS